MAHQNKDEVSAPAEFGSLRAYLATQGFSQTWISQHTDVTMTRGENADALKLAMKELPKA